MIREDFLKWRMTKKDFGIKTDPTSEKPENEKNTELPSTTNSDNASPGTEKKENA